MIRQKASLELKLKFTGPGSIQLTSFANLSFLLCGKSLDLERDGGGR